MVDTVIQTPVRCRRYLVFDTETTGKLVRQKKGDLVPAITEQPHILQLSFVVYDLFEHCVVDRYNSYVKVGEDVAISDFITGLTGIDRAKCNGQGAPILDVLERFYEAYVFCDCLVAHNIEFDITMIQIEVERNREAILAKAPQCLTIFNPIYEKMNRIERYCTMKRGTNLCGLVKEKKKEDSDKVDVKEPNTGLHPALALEITKIEKRVAYKWPRLEELHSKLFGDVPPGLHDAMVDVMACLRCYLKMRHGYDSGLLL